MSNKARKPSAKLNYIYNMGYQIFTMIIPLVTTPYISSVLLAEGVGKYSYTYSMVNYFILFAQLGFSYYAQREVAKVQNQKEAQSIIFYEILIVKALTVGISSTVYICCCLLNVFGDYTFLMWCWLILVVAQFFDVAFLFQGNEEFSKIVVRNLFIKIVGIVAIFVFVKTKEDVWIYVLSISVSNFLGIISTWIYLPKYLCKVNIKDLKPFKHLVPALRLFIPTIASVIYTYLDKTLIGSLIDGTFVQQEEVLVNGVTQVVEVTKRYSDLENGIYEQSEKIVKIGLSVITALGAVMLPRNAKESAAGNIAKLKENIYVAARFVMLISIPIMLGLFGIADNLIPWFLGEGFHKSVLYLRMFCPLVILIGLENIFGMQYLMAINRDKQYTISVLSGSIANVILNCILIPHFWGVGAIIASVTSELVIVLWMYKYIRKDISLMRIVRDGKNYIFSGCIMLALIYLTQIFMEATWYNTILLIIEGAIVYGVMLLLLKDEFIVDNISKILAKFKKS